MISGKIVKYKCGNVFLDGRKVGLAYVMRKWFKYTDEGNKIIDGFFVAFYGDSNDNKNAILPRNGKDIVSI